MEGSLHSVLQEQTASSILHLSRNGVLFDTAAVILHCSRNGRYLRQYSSDKILLYIILEVEDSGYSKRANCTEAGKRILHTAAGGAILNCARDNH